MSEHGFTGEMLDSLLAQRWREGFEAGKLAEREEARPEYEERIAGARRDGHTNGYQQAHREVGQELYRIGRDLLGEVEEEVNQARSLKEAKKAVEDLPEAVYPLWRRLGAP